MDEFLEGIAEQELLSQLPAHLSRQLAELDSQNVSWDEIGLLLAAAPAAGIALKGGARWSGNLWTAVKSELHSFLCTKSPDYADLRRQWKGHREKGSALAIASLSGVIGAKLGIASGVVAPFVIWMLVVALRITKQSLCQVLTAQLQPPSTPTTPAT